MLNVFRRATIIGRMRYLLFDRYYNRVIPIVMVAICIAATVLSSLMWGEMLQRRASPIAALIPILIIAGLGFISVVYHHMEQFGIFVLMVTTLVSDGVSTGTDTKITFSLILMSLWVTLWLFKLIVVDRKIRVRASPSNIPSVVFILVLLIAFFWSSEFAEPNVQFLYDDKLAVRLMTTVIIIVSFLVHYLYANTIRSIQTLKTIAWWFMITGLVYGVWLIFSDELPRPLNARGQFPTWVGIIALGQALFNAELSKRRRIFALAIVGIWVWNTLTGEGLGWLSGWVPLLLGSLVLIFLYSKRLFIIVLLISVTVYVGNQVLLESAAATESQVSGETRIDAWLKVIDVTLKHPLFGTGPVGYYFYFTVNIGGFFQLAHNNYVDILAQTGLIGFALWIAFWAALGVMTLRMYWIVPRRNNFEHALANTLLASYCCTMIAMMLGDWVTPFPYTQTLSGFDYTIWSWMFTGMTVALYYIVKESQQEMPVTDDSENRLLVSKEQTPSKSQALNT